MGIYIHIGVEENVENERAWFYKSIIAGGWFDLFNREHAGLIPLNETKNCLAVWMNGGGFKWMESDG